MGNQTTKRSFRRRSPIERANYGDIKTPARVCRVSFVERSRAGESTTRRWRNFVTRQSGFPSREERIVFHGKLIPLNYDAYVVTFSAGWRRFYSVLHWKKFLICLLAIIVCNVNVISEKPRMSLRWREFKVRSTMIANYSTSNWGISHLPLLFSIGLSFYLWLMIDKLSENIVTISSTFTVIVMLITLYF